MNRDNQLDIALIAKCLRGDRHAMTDLVKHYQRPVYNAAYRIVGNAEDAADITQTVFLKVFKHLQDYDSQYKFFSWVYRIAVNESINLCNKRQPMEPLSATEASGVLGPAEQLVQKRRDAALQVALMELNLEYRTVITLKHMSGFSYKEISDVLQVPEKTVKSRLYSARQLLKQQLLDSKPSITVQDISA
jgi:RNA polymerase sigma-70 factor (ECF subfamily)